MIHITKHAAKLKLSGLVSINTHPALNKWCNISSNMPGTVCYHCYAIRLLAGFRAACNKPFKENTRQLSWAPLRAIHLPDLGSKVCRHNSYGELINSWHYGNILKIAHLNPASTQSLLTKRSDIVQFKGGTDLPSNLTLVLSNLMVNFNPFEEPPAPFDKTFTVYPRGTKIPKATYPCPAKCSDCMVCYQKTGPKHIGETIR